MRGKLTGAAVVLMVVSILGFVGSLVAHGFTGDYDKYGSVPLPGTAKVTLPQGSVSIFFVAFTPNSGDGPVTIPDLKFSMDFPDTYDSPVVTDSTGSVTTVNTKEHVRVWKVQVKTAGTYTVTDSGDVGAFISPQLTFGKDSSFPGWLPIAFALLFVVSLGGLVVAQRIDDDDSDTSSGDGSGVRISVGPQASSGADRPGALDPELQQLMDAEAAARSTAAAAGAASPAATATAAPPPVSAPSTDTPEQSMARLQQLEQLQQLHAAGTLSDAEYDAARKRLGST